MLEELDLSGLYMPHMGHVSASLAAPERYRHVLARRRRNPAHVQHRHFGVAHRQPRRGHEPALHVQLQKALDHHHPVRRVA